MHPRITYHGGDHTLYQGDCLEVMTTFPDSSIDTVICDLPYGTTQCKWDAIIPFEPLWKEYYRVAKENAAFVMFSAQPFTSMLIGSNIKDYRHIWYWSKEKGTGFFRVSTQPLRIVEEVCIFSRTSRYTYNPQMIPLDKPYRHTMPLNHSDVTGRGAITGNGDSENRVYKTYTHKQPINLLKFSRDKSLIPSQKPIELVKYFVETYTNAGDLILDNTIGSGTTMFAAMHLGRRCIGIEKSEKNYEICRTRLA